MALKATIFKAELDVSDMDRQYYGTHSLTLARHPSETDERMMVRLLVFALHAHERLELGDRMGDQENPDLILKDLTGAIELWIEVGQPEDKPLLKACGKADEVVLYCFNHAAEVWWRGMESKLSRPRNLSVFRVPTVASQALIALAQRSMQLQATVQEGVLMLGDGASTVDIEPIHWK